MAHQSTVNPAPIVSPGALNSAVSSPRTTAEARALYLKLFSGEMFKGFQNNAIARDLVMKRTLKNGRSLQFIYTGRTTAEYHVPGQSIMGNDAGAPPVAEKTITIDDLLISSAFLYELDETLAHYDLRSEISRKIGYALAEKYDRLIFRAVTRGARAKNPVMKSGAEEPGGTQIQVGGGTDANDAYSATALVDAFYDAAAALDEKGVSTEGRVGVLNPRQYYKLIQQVGENGLINRDEQGTARQRGNGIVEIAGIKIYKSMNIPFLSKYGTAYQPSSGNDDTIHTNQAAPGNEGDFVGAAIEDAENTDSGINNDYGQTSDFANSCGLIFQREAAGVVEAVGPSVQVTSGDISVVYQGDVILGRLACGADYLNPAAAVELFAGVSTKPAQFGTVQTVANNAGYQ